VHCELFDKINMSSDIRSYRDLKVWKLSRELVKLIYEITVSFPPNEQYGLSEQLRRAAISIPSNIAEGQRRSTRADFRRFISIALGSTAEIETQILLAIDLKMVKEKDVLDIQQKADDIAKMLFSLYKKLE